MSIDSRHIVEQRSRAERTANAEVIPVPDPAPDAAYAGTESEESDAAGLPLVPLQPFLVRRSGIYRLEQPVLQPTVPQPIPCRLRTSRFPRSTCRSAPSADAGAGNGNGTAMHQEADEAGSPLLPLPPITPRFGFEELRVDVDGIKPTMTVSGTITRLFAGRLTWIARVTKDPATGAWTGPISYRDGSTALRPQASVAVQLTGGPFRPVNRKAIATFSGGTGSPLTLTYNFEQAAFREVAFEYDTVSDATAVTSHNPATHPIHAPSAPTSTLTLESAYARLGYPGDQDRRGLVDPDAPGHPGPTRRCTTRCRRTGRAGQTRRSGRSGSCSRGCTTPAPGLGGIMFDDIGMAQRQGTSIFSGSFIAQAPAGEANPGPWVERMKFWTAMHEIGHSFNLAHSWQKSLGTAWVPLANEPSALSYMNYPFNYPGGLDAFFAAFDYGFSPDELLFLRHAPERLVQMGAEPWFSNHGFEQEAFDQLRAAATGPLELEVRVHRETSFEFLEPVVAELRLKNVSSTPMVVDANALQGDGLAIVVAKDGGETKRWLPFARYCMAPAPQVLQPGDAIYESVFLSAGTGGWLVSEPGTYTVYAVTESEAGAGALSKPLKIVVERPTGTEAERLADDVFTKEVAHTLAFGGSRVLTGANETLQQVAEQLPESRAAVHANSVLGAPMVSDGKVLVTDEDGNEAAEIVAGVTGGGTGAARRSARRLRPCRRLARAHRGDGADEALREGAGRRGRHLGEGSAASSAADALARRGVLPGVVEALRNE